MIKCVLTTFLGEFPSYTFFYSITKDVAFGQKVIFDFFVLTDDFRSISIDVRREGESTLAQYQYPQSPGFPVVAVDYTSPGVGQAVRTLVLDSKYPRFLDQRRITFNVYSKLYLNNWYCSINSRF